MHLNPGRVVYIKKLNLKVEGPIDLGKTLTSGQTSGIWYKNKNNEKYLKSFKNGFISINKAKNSLKVEYSGLDKNFARKVAEKGLTLNYPFNKFRRLVQEDKDLKKVYDKNRGLRLTKSIDPFEGIICSILSQNISVKRWVSVAKKISEKFGEKNGEENIYVPPSFPSPEKLKSADLNELKKCGTGYRASYIKGASEWLFKNGLDEVKEKSKKEVREILLEIKGIGPKVADCILLYGFGFTEVSPIDVHIKRILDSKNYNKCRKEMEKKYGKHAGLAQLYLYDDERRKPRKTC